MLNAGAARTDITPFWGVELAGWGYFLKRYWRDVADPLAATALAFENEGRPAIVVSLELMVANEAFVRRTRDRISQAINVPAGSILICCTHTHNAPACGGLLGVGETDPEYFRFASHQAATAAILAWEGRRPARTAPSTQQVDGLQFNRTRPEGVYDSALTVLRVDEVGGAPIGAVVNFAGHPTVETELQPYSVSGDLPGRVRRGVEAAEPERLTAYLQGACGDVNFLREFQTPTLRAKPSERLTEAARSLLESAEFDPNPQVSSLSQTVSLPTRRWTEAEILADREDAQRRVEENDFTDWRETIGRSMTNRPADMVKRHEGDERQAVRAMCQFNLQWTERMLADYKQRPTHLDTNVQAMRVGSWSCVSNASEFFSPFALQLREQLPGPLAIACYANGRIGYLPDAYDIERKSYAGWQSPKYCDQFPFVAESAEVMTAAMRAAVQNVRTMR